MSEVASEVTTMYMMEAAGGGGEDPYEKLYRGDS